MKHADYLVERIIDGMPNLQDLGKLKIGENVPEMLEADLGAETNNQARLKDAIVACENARDFLSRQVLENILDDTEEHIDWIETQQCLIEGTGIQNYLQEQMFECERVSSRWNVFFGKRCEMGLDQKVRVFSFLAPTEPGDTKNKEANADALPPPAPRIIN